jgi:hypothetical protein
MSGTGVLYGNPLRRRRRCDLRWEVTTKAPPSFDLAFGPFWRLDPTGWLPLIVSRCRLPSRSAEPTRFGLFRKGPVGLE